MKNFTAIALLEFSTIGRGIKAGDAMLKKSPISMIKAGTVSGGRYIILIGGSTASVDEAYQEGLKIGGETVRDNVILPDVHPEVYSSISGGKIPIEMETLGIIETSNIASMIRCADAAVKGADVHIVEMRLADQLGGKSFILLNGVLEEVEAALDIGVSRIEGSGSLIDRTIIPRFDSEYARHTEASTRFAKSEHQKLVDGEL